MQFKCLVRLNLRAKWALILADHCWYFFKQTWPFYNDSNCNNEHVNLWLYIKHIHHVLLCVHQSPWNAYFTIIKGKKRAFQVKQSSHVSRDTFFFFFFLVFKQALFQSRDVFAPHAAFSHISAQKRSNPRRKEKYIYCVFGRPMFREKTLNINPKHFFRSAYNILSYINTRKDSWGAWDSRQL